MADTLKLRWPALNSAVNSPTAPCDITEENYRSLRLALIRFLEHHGSASPEDHADETIVRVLSNQAAGVTVDHLGAYTYQVARHVISEHHRESRRFVELSSEWAESRVDDEDQQQTNLERCYLECLRSLSVQDRRLVERYYRPEGAHKVAAHEAMAAEMGMSINTLRVRIFRIRKRLNACVKARMQLQDTPSRSRGPA